MKPLLFSSIRLIPLSFLLTILTGAILLTLPVSSATGSATDFITALFTATTSVCVTGLVVVDTFSHWSLFGHIVILVLIQLGGLGVISVLSMLMLITQRKFSLSNRKILQDSLNLNTDVGVLKFLKRVFRGTIATELAGAALYSYAFVPEFGFVKGLWISLFNSVSAFCNAGIDIMGPDSLERFQEDPYVLGITMVLIIMGGLGFVVWFDISNTTRSGLARRFNPIQIFKRFNEHTKVAITVTFFLIISGAICFYASEYDNPFTIGRLGQRDRIINCLFQSVTLRTAGFCTFPQENLSGISCIIADILMFIGGSPMGTAGGIKTVTFFLMLLWILSYIRAKDKTIIFKRKVNDELMHKATVVVILAMFNVIILTLLLLAVNPMSAEDALFEIISGSGTVGLTRGITSTLNNHGRLVVIAAMYLGRIGPVSMALFFTNGRPRKRVNDYLEGKFYVG